MVEPRADTLHWLFDGVTPTGTFSGAFVQATGFRADGRVSIHGVRRWNTATTGATAAELWDTASQSLLASKADAGSPTVGWVTTLFDEPITLDHDDARRFVAVNRLAAMAPSGYGFTNQAASRFNRPGPVVATETRYAEGGEPSGFPTGNYGPSGTSFYMVDIVFSTDSWQLGLVKGAGGENLALINPDDDAELDNPAWLQLIGAGGVQAVEVQKINRVDWAGLP